jgi:hypothetical protein
MDLLSFNPTYNILICTSCKYAIHSTAVAGHLYDHHKAAIPLGKVQEYSRLFTPDSLLPPREVKQLHVSTHTPPISHLRIYDDASYCCKLCPPNQPYVIRGEQILLNHLKEAHQWSKSKGFADRPAKSRLPLSTAAYFPVVCQTFHTKGYTRYFLVNNGKPGSDLAPVQLAEALEKPPLSLREQVEQALVQKLQAARPDITSRHKTEVSPWLDLTQWERYFRGHNLSRVIRLLDLPSPHPLFDPDQPDNHLVLILDSFDRLIEQARESLRTDRINIFDQQRVSSFLTRRTTNFSLVHKLQEGTYNTYKKVWKQLLSFVYRRIWRNQGPELSYRLTDAQVTALDRVMQAAAELAQEQQSTGLAPVQLQKSVDYATIQLCVSLLDHALFDTIYDEYRRRLFGGSWYQRSWIIG